MVKRKEIDETEFKGDPSAAWQDDSDTSVSTTTKTKISVSREASNRIDASEIPEEKMEVVDLNKPLDFSNDPIINADVFKNRREMAWLSLYIMIGLIIFLFIFLMVVLGLFIWKPAIMKLITADYKTYLEWSSSFIGWGFSAFSTVILAYMGMSAYFYNSYMKNMKK